VAKFRKPRFDYVA